MSTRNVRPILKRGKGSRRQLMLINGVLSITNGGICKHGGSSETKNNPFCIRWSMRIHNIDGLQTLQPVQTASIILSRTFHGNYFQMCLS